MTPTTFDRNFMIWEYQASHSMLLVRSPKSPAHGDIPPRVTNVDILFTLVDFINLPAVLLGVTMDTGTEQECFGIEAMLGKAVERSRVHVLQSMGRRFHVVASKVSISENDWETFQSPIEHRSWPRVPGLRPD